MNYMEQFQRQQVALAYDQFRSDFAAKLFPGGLEEATPLALDLAALLFPGSDCLCEHYQTCFAFYSTYALTRLMGYDHARAEIDCKNKYAGISPLTLQQATQRCQAQLQQTFPSLT
jgi:hypothetical protein